jgi:VIT1/CCC1 family predicted Fe2+/Mn2+ transporter/rubrerythrin
MAPADIAQSLDNLKLERDAIVLYDALASIEKDERRAVAFRTIAANERRHAQIWATKLEERGAHVPPPGGARLRVRFIILLARVFGTHAVSELVQALEGDEEELYDAQASPEVASIAADEREHAEIWRRLSSARQVAGDGRATASLRGDESGQETDRAGRRAAAVIESAARSRAAGAAEGLPPIEEHPRGGDGRAESWHRTGQSGTLRAVIFGVSDGLVSNLSLVMGVAGATTSEPRFILLAGIAGLLAGAFSMAAGEYISMRSQRELYERQIALERAELEMMPEEEEAELARLYRARGFSADEARTIAHRIFRDPEVALETLIREELGLDPNQLGSPWGAASGSFLAFAAGAAVPVVPYLFGGGGAIFATSLGLSLVALFTVGAGVSLITGRGLLFSGVRQVLIGAAAAAVTFGVGRLIGVSVS